MQLSGIAYGPVVGHVTGPLSCMEVRVSRDHKAFTKSSVDSFQRSHKEQAQNKTLEESAIHDRIHGRYIGDIVYGALDGIVTTFAVISGVAGASLPSGIVLILGFANLFADGLSMAVGNYLGTKSQREYQERERAREIWEIEHLPEAERQEVRLIYANKGFTGALLEQVVDVITSDKKRWLDTMMLEELQIVPNHDTSPKMAGFMTFISFVIAGFIPLLPYVLSYAFPFFETYMYPIAVMLTFITLFAVGSLRVYVTGKQWWRSGLEMLLVGGATALVAYLIGYALRGLA